MNQKRLEILAQAGHRAMGEHFEKRGELLDDRDKIWSRLSSDVQELYKEEAQAIVNAYFEDVEYKTLRAEAINILYLLNNGGTPTADALLHLGEFFALSGGL